MPEQLKPFTRLANWINGLLGAVIGGVANSILANYVRPDVFNFGDGRDDLLKLLAGSAIISAALFLKTKPTPFIDKK